jgi:3-oxoacyl-[acyl-carrier-protein] synthase-3
VREYAAAQGADVTDYRSWDNACHGGPEDHPSTMGERALRRALTASGVSPSHLRLVVYAGSSRDYPASWSVSTEIMRLCGVPDSAVGIDMMAGCVATLAAVDFVHGWLGSHGGGCAAVVSCERWTQTVDFADASSRTLWGHADGAGALVVGLDTGTQGVVQFLGAEFCSKSALNGHVLVPYGGTREPQPPPGVSASQRRVSDRPVAELIEAYLDAYSQSYEAVVGRFEVRPTHLICNQTTPGVVSLIGKELDQQGSTTITGHATGHLGGPDILVGLDTYLAGNPCEQVIALAASATYAFGTGLLVKP